MSEAQQNDNERPSWGPSIVNRAIAVFLVLVFEAQREDSQYVKGCKLDESSDIYIAEVEVSKEKWWQLMTNEYRENIHKLFYKTKDEEKTNYDNFFTKTNYNYEFSRYIQRLIKIGLFDSERESFQGRDEWKLKLKLKEPNNLVENIRLLIERWNENQPSRSKKIKEDKILYNLNQSQNKGELNRQDLSDPESVKRRSLEEAKSFTPKIGIPFQAPPLLIHFVDRPEVTQGLKKRLIAESTDQFGTLVISAIHGLGGIGKTILAQALAHDPQVQERFYDGVLWTTLGQEPNVLYLLQQWIIALNDHKCQPTTIQEASNHLNSLLYDKAVLLVIDDGWNVEDIEPFRVGSGKCQAVVTTRLVSVAKKFDARSCQLELMSEDLALTTLVKRSGRELDETGQKLAKQLAEAVGYLPLALNLVAGHIAEGKTWKEVYDAVTTEINRLKALKAEDDEFIIVKSTSKNESVEACFNVSLNFLQKKYSPEICSSFFWMGVLPEDVNISPPMLATLWKVEVTIAQKILEILWNNSLLLPGVDVRIDRQEWRGYRIHDLLHDLAIKWLIQEKNPGLRLTIPKAHRILLERYQNHLSGGEWHELADDGYIHEHLIWHMEKAGCVEQIHQLLQEETDTRKNGWHSKCESLGKTAIFVGDVARAWRLAESEYNFNPGRAIGLQCRYALIISSLNTIATNISPKLISVLVDKKVWTLAQGLAYSRQVQSLSQRVQALSSIAPHLPEIWSEALEVARNIGDQFEKAQALSSIAPHLPEIWSEALEVARNIGDESHRTHILSKIAPYLPENLLPQALEIARNTENKYKRADILISIAPHLPENLLSQALEIARNTENKYKRADILISIAPHLPENLLSQALEIARNIGDQFEKAQALSSIAPHLPEIWSEALEVARNIENELRRIRALSKIALYQPEIWLEALEVAQNMGNEYKRVQALSSIAPHLPEIWSEVLEVARNTANEYERADILISIAPHLPENLLSQALEIARNIENELMRANILVSIAPHLPEIWSEALEVARNTKDELMRANILVSIAPHLPEIWSEALEVARNTKDELMRAYILRLSVLHLPEIWSEALEAARDIGDEFERAMALGDIAPHQPEICSEVLEAARNTKDELRRAHILSNIAPHLPENLLPQALEIARDIGSEYERANILSLLVPNIDKMSASFPYDFWCELIHSLASLKRRELLHEIGKNSDIIKELGSSKTFREIADAVENVGRWFP